MFVRGLFLVRSFSADDSRWNGHKFHPTATWESAITAFLQTELFCNLFEPTEATGWFTSSYAASSNHRASSTRL